MKTTQKRVTPDMAAKWLEGNTHNRTLRQSVVDKYARDMKEGNWRLTHQGIAFDPDGTLVDGQHRLWAVLNSGATIDLNVSEGVEMDAQEVIDGGEVRQVRDVIKLRGESTDPLRVGIAKILCIQLSGNRSPTRTETVETYDEYKDGINFAASLFTKRVKGIWITPVVTPLARAYYSQDATPLQRFATVLAEGFSTGPEDRPTIMLRNWLLERNPKRSDIYGKTERALHAFLTGEKISTLYASSEELFPLPVEQKKIDALKKRKKKA